MVTAITVIGGTGYAGSAIAREAASRGHAVTSVSRTAPATAYPGVTYVETPAAEAGPMISGADVVVAALSPRGTNIGTLPALYRQLGQQAADAGARFVIIGGFGSLRPSPGAPRFVESPNFPAAYVGESRELAAVLAEFTDGAVDADWLFVSPASEFGAYAPGVAVGRYRIGDDVALFDENGASAISGADFAHAVLDEIEKPSRHNAQIGFAY